MMEVELSAFHLDWQHTVLTIGIRQWKAKNVEVMFVVNLVFVTPMFVNMSLNNTAKTEKELDTNNQ